MGLFRELRDEWKLRQLIALQLDSGRPPEVRAAYDRLLAAGLAEREARRLVRSALALEVRSMVRDRRVFDAVGFARALAALPGEPSPDRGAT